jgi:hypothetical protein
MPAPSTPHHPPGMKRGGSGRPGSGFRAPCTQTARFGCCRPARVGGSPRSGNARRMLAGGCHAPQARTRAHRDPVGASHDDPGDGGGARHAPERQHRGAECARLPCDCESSAWRAESARRDDPTPSAACARSDPIPLNHLVCGGQSGGVGFEPTIEANPRCRFSRPASLRRRSGVRALQTR